jgi:hypothetical protein
MKKTPFLFPKILGILFAVSVITACVVVPEFEIRTIDLGLKKGETHKVAIEKGQYSGTVTWSGVDTATVTLTAKEGCFFNVSNYTGYTGTLTVEISNKKSVKIIVKFPEDDPDKEIEDVDLKGQVAIPVNYRQSNNIIYGTIMYQGTIEWFDNDGNSLIGSFAPGTVYKAEVNLEAKHGFYFTDKCVVTFTGMPSGTRLENKTYNSGDGTLNITVTFPPTQKLIKYTAIANAPTSIAPSTRITFTFFDPEDDISLIRVPGLLASELTITNNANGTNGKATKDKFFNPEPNSEPGTVWYISISSVTPGDITVRLDHGDVVKDEKIVTLHAPGTTLINAERPTITTQPVNANYSIGATVTPLTVAATVSDGGTLSYQWYSNTANVSAGGTVINGAKSTSYTPPATTMGTIYYYAMVTNTNTGSNINGNTTATMPSNPATVTVTPNTYTATADGTNNTQTSTKINFVFTAAVTGLTAAEVTITDGVGASGGVVTKGTVTGTGTAWSISLTDVVTAGNVSVKIDHTGVDPTTKTVPVYKAAPLITYAAMAEGTPDTTRINFAFSAPVTGLTAGEVTIANGTGQATKGSTIGGTGSAWYIDITVATAGTVSVSINHAGVETGSKTVTVNKAAAPPITYSVSANGTAGSVATTELTFTFGSDPGALAATDITITPGNGSATRGALTGTGNGRTLAVSAVSQGTVTVSIAFTGVETGGKSVTVNAVSSGGDASITVVFKLPEDEDIDFNRTNGPILISLFPITVTVTGYSSVDWRIDGKDSSETGASLEVKIADLDEPLYGTHKVTAIVEKDGMYYSKNLTFSIVP